MKSYKLTGLNTFSLQDVDSPTITRPEDVLISVARVGVCGSDVHYYREGGIGSQIVQYPWSVGHEGSGTVIETGSAVARVKVGDRVAFDPASPCGHCSQCLIGRPHTCENMTFLGCPGQVEGCLSELLILPERSCLSVPDEMTLEEAAMVEPLSIAVYGASLYPKLVGGTVGILGCGPIGLCLLQVVRHAGAARVYVTDRIDNRLMIARDLGADWTGNPDKIDAPADLLAANGGPLDVVFECCGQQAALDQAVQVLKPGGELSLIGIPETNRISFDINQLRRKELRIQNVRRQNDCMQAALGLINSGAVKASSMITHRFHFSQTPDAFDLVSNYRDGVVKAMISFD